MKRTIGCLFWIIVIVLLFAYCSRPNQEDTFITTSAKYIKAQKDAVDSIFNSKPEQL